ncbi:unnamed protein product, partial [Urochloa humidicola]
RSATQARRVGKCSHALQKDPLLFRKSIVVLQHPKTLALIPIPLLSLLPARGGGRARRDAAGHSHRFGFGDVPAGLLPVVASSRASCCAGRRRRQRDATGRGRRSGSGDIPAGLLPVVWMRP